MGSTLRGATPSHKRNVGAQLELQGAGDGRVCPCATRRHCAPCTSYLGPAPLGPPGCGGRGLGMGEAGWAEGLTRTATTKAPQAHTPFPRQAHTTGSTGSDHSTAGTAPAGTACRRHHRRRCLGWVKASAHKARVTSHNCAKGTVSEARKTGRGERQGTPIPSPGLHCMQDPPFKL